MGYQANIVTRDGQVFGIHLEPALVERFDQASARAWIDQAFNDAGLVPPNPMGKVLLVDQILLLAQEQRDAVWAQPDAKTLEFLAATATALARTTVTIDIKECRL